MWCGHHSWKFDRRRQPIAMAKPGTCISSSTDSAASRKAWTCTSAISVWHIQWCQCHKPICFSVQRHLCFGAIFQNRTCRFQKQIVNHTTFGANLCSVVSRTISQYHHRILKLPRCCKMKFHWFRLCCKIMCPLFPQSTVSLWCFEFEAIYQGCLCWLCWLYYGPCCVYIYICWVFKMLSFKLLPIWNTTWDLSCWTLDLMVEQRDLWTWHPGLRISYPMITRLSHHFFLFPPRVMKFSSIRMFLSLYNH